MLNERHSPYGFQLADITDTYTLKKAFFPHLLLGEPLLDLLIVTDVIDDGLRKLGLDSSQPGTKVAHGFV